MEVEPRMWLLGLVQLKRAQELSTYVVREGERKRSWGEAAGSFDLFFFLTSYVLPFRKRS